MQPRLSIQILPLESQILLSLVIYFGFVAQIASATPKTDGVADTKNRQRRKYRTTNWKAYSAALKARGALAMDMAGPGDAM